MTVGLTHMEAGVRQNSCKVLHLVCTSTDAALPDSLTLLECCFRMLAATTRPKDRSQPPVMQAYIALLKSNLAATTADSWGGAAVTAQFLGSTSSATPTAAAASSVDTHVDLTTFQAISRYLTGTVASTVFSHWIESVQDKGTDTKVGAWELGLLDILNSLFLSIAVRQGHRPLTARYGTLPKAFRHTVAGLCSSFPFGSGVSDASRVNTQFALFLSSFLGMQSFNAFLANFAQGVAEGDGDDANDAFVQVYPEDGDAAAAEASQQKPTIDGGLVLSKLIGDWVTAFMKHPHNVRGLRPEDVRALTVVIERLNKYGGPGVAEAIPSVGRLLQSCGSVASPISGEVLAALHRMMAQRVQTCRPSGAAIDDCVCMFPPLLYELGERLHDRAAKGGAAGAAAAAAATLLEERTADGEGPPGLAPTVDGGAVAPPPPGASEALQAVAFHLLDLVKLRAHAGADGASLPRTLREDLRHAVFGAVGEAGAVVATGLLRHLPAQLAHLAVSLTPHLVDDFADDAEEGEDEPVVSTASAVLTLTVECLGLSGVVAEAAAAEGGDEAAAAAAASHQQPSASKEAARANDLLLAYSLELLRDCELSDSAEVLTGLGAAGARLPEAAARAALVLSDYDAEEGVDA